MTAEKEQQGWALHPIQIESVRILELHIKPLVQPDLALQIEGTDVSLSSAHSRFDAENGVIQVAVKVEAGFKEDQKEAPFQLRVELAGRFRVNSDAFPIDQINHWASHNAPLILFPYLREHVFALTGRSGFRPFLMPLMEVPTFKIDQGSKSAGNVE